MTRVLVVEDEPSIRMPLVDVLLSEGYEVLEAEDGDQAVEPELRKSMVSVCL